MTRERIENCYLVRKELALTKRRLEACGENSHQFQYLKERADELAAEISSIEAFIASLDSSILRQIATLRYVEGLSLAETGTYVGYSHSQVGRYTKKLFDGYL